MKRFIFLSLWMTLALNVPLYGEDSHSGSAQASGARKISETKLSDEMVTFVADHFGFDEAYIREKRETPIAEAIEKAIKNDDEKPISEQMSFLMGRANRNQKEKAAQDAKNLINEELKKGKEKDERKIVLLSRVLYAAASALNIPIEDFKMDEKQLTDFAEKAKEFDKEFVPLMKAEIEKNKEALEKIKQAAEGHEDSKKWVRENLSQKALLSFATAQRKTGNDELADQIIDAASINFGKQRVLELTGHDGSPQRLFLGETKDSRKKAIDEFDKFNAKTGGGFGGARVAFNQHKTNPQKAWYVNDKGAFTKGNPPGVDLPKIEDTTPPGGGNGGGNGGGGGAPSAQDIAAFNQLKALASTKCTDCHGTSVSGTSIRDAQITLSGQVTGQVNMAGLNAAFQPGGAMDSYKIAGEVRGQIQAWAALAAQ